MHDRCARKTCVETEDMMSSHNAAAAAAAQDRASYNESDTTQFKLTCAAQRSPACYHLEPACYHDGVRYSLPGLHDP